MSAVVEGAPAGITRTDSQPRPSTPAPPSAMTALLAMKAPSALPRLVITGSLGPALLDFAAATGTRLGFGGPKETLTREIIGAFLLIVMVFTCEVPGRTATFGPTGSGVIDARPVPSLDSRTVLTCAPAGGVKLKFDAAGWLKLSEVKPTLNAGLPAPRAKTWTSSGR